MRIRSLSSGSWVLGIGVALASSATASPFAYVANNGNTGVGGYSVSVIDTASNTVIATVPFGLLGHPRSATVNAAGTKVYVTTQVGDSVAVIDAFTNSIADVVPLGPFPPSGFPEEAVLSPDGSKLYVAAGFQNVQVLNTSSNTFVATITDTSGDYTNNIAINPSGSRVYVSHYSGAPISVIDTATNMEVATISGPAAGLAVHPSGSPVYAATGSAVNLIDPLTNSISGTIPLSCGAYGLALNPTGTTLYAICFAGLEVIDTATNMETTVVTIGDGGFGLSLTRDGARVYAVNMFNGPDSHGTVSVVDTATNNVVATVPVDIQAEGKGQFIGPQFTCGNGVLEPGEGCDDGNTMGGDSCPADCLVRHDSIVLLKAPLTVTVPKNKFFVQKKIPVTVKNGDVGETPGHTIQLDASTDCPGLNASISQPDFGGGLNRLLVKGGKTKTAKATLSVNGGIGVTNTFNYKAPTRCTVTFTASTFPALGTVETTPSNNVVTMDINLIDKNDPETTTATVHESVLTSIAPMTINIPKNKPSTVKKAHPKVVNADYRPTAEDAALHSIGVTRTGGTCPALAVGSVDFIASTPAVDNPIAVKGGTTKAGALPLTINRTDFPAATSVSPQRCTVTLQATGPTDPETAPLDATNNTTTLTIDVLAK